MANLRIVYNNVFDDATLATPDAYPSMPAQNAQSAGRLNKTRLKQVASIVDPMFSDKIIPGSATQTAVTLSFWIYRTGSLPYGPVDLVQIGTDTPGRFISISSAATTGIDANYYNGSTYATATTKTLTLNTWYHVAVTWTAGDVLKFYVDGSQVGGDVNPSSDTDINSSYLTLGYASLNAKIARLAVWARVLDASEITELAGHRYVSDDALQERWNFNSSVIGDRGTDLGAQDGASPPPPTYSTGPGAHATSNMTQFKGAWTSGQVIDTVAICRHNLPAAATVKLILYSDTAYGTSVYDSGTSTAYSGTRTGDYLNYAHYFTPTTAQSFALEVQNSGTAWDCCRVVMGSGFTPSVNAGAGHDLAWRETGFQARTEGGAIVSEPGEIYRAMRVSLNRITEDERTTMSGLLYSIGANREMWLSLYPKSGNTQKEMDYSLLCIAASPALVHPHYGNYSVSFNVEET